MRRHWIAAATRHKKLAPLRVRTPTEADLARTIERVRAICVALPDVNEDATWEKPHFRTSGKIFAGCGDPRDPLAIGFKLALPHARRRCRDDPRFKRAAYVGAFGWVTMNLGGKPKWAEVATLLEESYRLIAKRRSVAKLTAERDGAASVV